VTSPIFMTYADKTANNAAAQPVAKRSVLAMSIGLRTRSSLAARGTRCVRRSLSVGDLHRKDAAVEDQEVALKVSCSIRDSRRLFDLALDAGGFSVSASVVL
jgi:hypothetical protein